MNYDTYPVRGFCVIRLKEDVTPRTDLQDVREQVERLLNEGHTRIALAFTRSSFLDSRAIGNLANCLELVRARKGRLAVVQPNPEIADFLRLVGFSRFIDIYSTEAELGLSL
jgi:anti-anti-sigma factor